MKTLLKAALVISMFATPVLADTAPAKDTKTDTSKTDSKTDAKAPAKATKTTKTPAKTPAKTGDSSKTEAPASK